MGHQLRAAGVSHPGTRKKVNEDAYRIYHGDPRIERSGRGAILAVADGIGGHKAGGQASRMAVDQLWLYFQYPPERFHGEATIEELIRGVNRAIWEAGRHKGAHYRMGCTLSVLAFDPKFRQAHVFHAGDSRIYRLVPGKPLRQVTVDHSDPGRDHALANHIGKSEDIYIERSSWVLRSGERWMLCTDGLLLGVTSEEIEEVLRSVAEPQQAAQRLVDLANRDGRDNVTVIVADLVSDQPQS